MQHVLRISRKIDYGLRAMIYLSSIRSGSVVPFREIARQMDVPEDFLAKILKTLVDQGLVRSTRGPHGGYAFQEGARLLRQHGTLKRRPQFSPDLLLPIHNHELHQKAALAVPDEGHLAKRRVPAAGIARTNR